MTDPERPVVGVGGVVVRDDSLLLIRRGRGPAQGEWSLPGGHVEAGETMAEAIVREVREETGLSGVCGDFIGWTELIADDLHFVILDFQVVLLDDDEEATAGDDADEVAWVPLHDVAEWPLVGGLAEFLHDHEVIQTIL